MSTGEFDGTKDEPGRWQFAPPQKPDVTPSNTPYVSPARHPEAGIVSASTPEFCKYEGFTLRGLLANFWRIPESRIEFRGSFDDKARFDFVLVPADPERTDMDTLMRDGITTHFGLDLYVEDQAMDVLVLSAPNGIVGLGPDCGGVMSSYGTFALEEPMVPGLQEVPDEFPQHLSAGPDPWMSLASELSVSGTATVELVRDMLERLQDRLVVDETGAAGSFEVDLRVDSGVEGLVAVLRDKLGIVTTPSRRDVRMLAVRRL